MDDKKLNPEPTSFHFEDEGLSLKELVHIILEYVSVLKKALPYILVLSLLCGILFSFLEKKKATFYTSALTFIVGESQESSSSKGITPFDQFKFEEVKDHKITEIARSNTIVRKVLKSPVHEANQTISDRISEVYGIDNTSVDSQKLANILHEFLVGNKLNGRIGLMDITYADRTELFTLKIKSIDSELSNVILDHYFKELSDFYIDKTVGRYKASYKALRNREDSLKVLLSKIENDITYVSDRSRGVRSSVVDMNRTRVQRKFDAVDQEYEESKVNRQRVENILQKDTPDFQIIDKTFNPLIQKPATIKNGIFGFLLILFLSSGFVVARHLIKKALKA